VRPHFELVTSDFVYAEFSLAPETKASQARDFFAGIRVLPPKTGFERLVTHYIEQRVMPDDALGDAAHLAIASQHGIDFILTWNCRHLANANKRKHIEVVNARLGLRTPIIATPFELPKE
jgi:hypothetical protein